MEEFRGLGFRGLGFRVRFRCVGMGLKNQNFKLQRLLYGSYEGLVEAPYHLKTRVLGYILLRLRIVGCLAILLLFFRPDLGLG